MEEKIVFMQVEDMMVTFEKQDGDTIIYPITLVPEQYKEGDIIRAIIHLDWIEFIDIDTDEMRNRKERLAKRLSKLRERARRNSKK